MSVKCRWCDETVADAKDETLAAAHWGWTMAPDIHGPGWFYACPECSDRDQKDAFAFIRRLASTDGPSPEVKI